MSRKTKFRLSALLMVFAFVLSSCRPGSGATTTEQKPNNGIAQTSSGVVKTLRLGQVLAPTHPYTIGGEKFAELVNEKTNGGIKVEVFHSSQLRNERDMIEGLQLGTIEMAILSNIKRSCSLH